MIKNRMAQRGQAGFTLIELLVVVAILAILVGVAVVGIGAMRENANKSACKADRDTLQTAALAAIISDELTAVPTVAYLETNKYIQKIDDADWAAGTDINEPTYTVVDNNNSYGDLASADCNI